MIYFLKFLIIYLRFSFVCRAMEDFDDFDYDSEDYANDDRRGYLSPRQTDPHQRKIPADFIGSNLLGNGLFSKQCFSVEDVALLATRVKFEALVPSVSSSTHKLEDDKSVELSLEYFYGFSDLLNIIEKEDLKFFSQQAFYDVVGGYLNYLYWPLVKYSFYAGMLTYNSTVSVYTLQKHCKDALNTVGNGWRRSKDLSKLNFKIEPISPTTTANQSTVSIVPPIGRDNPCEKLLLASDEENSYRFETDLIVSLPQIEPDNGDEILTIRIPFVRKQNFNFNSKTSAFVLLKYYVTVSQCYEYRKQSSQRFDMRFQKLINEKFLPLLRRDTFYPGFGAILRITETLSHRAVVLRNVEVDSSDMFDQLKSNETESDDIMVDNQNEVLENERNETSFFEQVAQFIGQSDTDNKSKKIEIIFFILVASVLTLSLLIVCCCFIMKRKRKNNSKENLCEKKKSGFTSFFKRSKESEKEKEKTTDSYSNIGPRSSSVLMGNDFDDTESKVSTQTKSSGLSLKDLIHAEISKRPTRPSKGQVKALSRSSKSKS